jgi:ATP-binding cassette subfamily B protein
VRIRPNGPAFDPGRPFATVAREFIYHRELPAVSDLDSRHRIGARRRHRLSGRPRTDGGVSTVADGLDPAAGDPVVRLVRRYAGTELPLFVVGVVTGVAGRGASLVPPVVLGVAIDALFGGNVAYALPGVPDAVIPPGERGQLELSVALVVGSLAVAVALGWAQGVSLSLFSNRVQHAVRVDAYDAMQRLDMAFFDDERTGQLLAILNDDVRNLRNFLGSTVSSALQLVATLLGIAAILVWMNAGLAVVTLVAVPLLAAFTVWFMRRIRPLYRALRASVGDLNSRLETNVGGIEVVKTSNAEAFELDRVGDASYDYFLRAWAVAKLEYLYQPTMDFLAGVAFAVTFLVGGGWLLFGPPAPVVAGLAVVGLEPTTLRVGEFVTFLFVTQRFVDPLSGVGRIVNSYENARSSAERVFGLVDRPAAVGDAPDAIELDRAAVRGRVVYDGVSFGYRPEAPVIADLSVVVEPGETVALVGPTGAGKSTAAKLLMRLYDPTAGAIELDGRDARDYRLDDLRSAVGYVSQDVFLFDGTVRENVTYGAFDASDEAIVAAAEAAEADRFVRSLPDGYDTLVGERGVKLSGGQRQRLAIARAILQDPAVLVLDEATSAVDTETELLIRRGLDRLMDGRTTVAIAHRLSTIRDADRIVVLDEGTVVESGTHDDLLAADGLYAALWGVQAGELADLPPEFVERARERVERATADGGVDDAADTD